MKRGASSREILGVYKEAGIISEEEFETLVAYDESLMQDGAVELNLLSRATPELGDYYYTTTRISYDTIFDTIADVTITAIATVIAAELGVGAAIVMIPARFIYNTWRDNQTFEGEGIKITIRWVWAYNDNEMQERWHPQYDDYEVYY